MEEKEIDKLIQKRVREEVDRQMTEFTQSIKKDLEMLNILRNNKTFMKAIGIGYFYNSRAKQGSK